MLYLTRSRVTVAVVTLVAWSTVSLVLAGGLLLTMLGNHPLSTLYTEDRYGQRPAGRQAPAATSLRLQPRHLILTPLLLLLGTDSPAWGGQGRLYNHGFYRSKFKSNCCDLLLDLILFKKLTKNAHTKHYQLCITSTILLLYYCEAQAKGEARIGKGRSLKGL